MRFLEYLITESVMFDVGVDPEDETTNPTNDVKKRMRDAMRDPIRATQEREKRLKSRKGQIKANEENPQLARDKEAVRQERLRLVQKQQKIIKQEKNLEQKRAREAGFAGGVVK